MAERKRGGLFLLGLAALMIAGPGVRLGAEEPSRLASVRHALHLRELEVIIQVEGLFQHNFFELQDPPRLVIDLTTVREVSSPPEIPIGAMGVEKIRTGLPKTDTARVVFELSGQRPFYLISRLPDGLKVTFLDSAAGMKPPAPEIRPALPSPPAEEREPTPHAGSQAPHSRPQTSLLGACLANVHLADERFGAVFGEQTASALAVDFSQVFLRKSFWSLAAAVENRHFSLEGRSTVTGQESRTAIRPLDLGLRVILEIGSFRPYASAGPVFFSYQERSPLHDTTGYATGISLQAGLYWGPSSFPLLKAKAFLKWTRALAEENGLVVDLGGIEVGAGLALAFTLF